ncbi:hypothetical protein NMY22_g11943 [Coprinellus aureogranulatus]|nr:hypothetical protein NMY22_g11943 [Coprinellus aureogranulatus]
MHPTPAAALALLHHPRPRSEAPEHTGWSSLAPNAVCDIQLGVNLQAWLEILSDWRGKSHARMPVSDGPELWGCRQVYTDACILAAVIHELLGEPFKAIAILDHALIIAGAAGESRWHTIHSLIKWLQEPLSRVTYRDPGAFTAVTGPGCSTHPPLISSALTIPRISAPSFLAFQSTHSKQPFIVADYARDWPALNEHPWRRASYLRSVSGPGRVVPVEVGNNYLRDDWKQVIMSWDKFIASLHFDDQTPSDHGELYYLAQHDLFMQMPDLQDDLNVPDYAYASLVSDGRIHIPPSNGSQLLINSWLGPQGTVSPPHTDPYHNLYVQVVGHKTVWLAPPAESIAATMTPKELSTLQNTSRREVFGASADSDLVSTVVPHAMSATLNPGDLLFFPKGWWHAMRSESTSFSVSFWF